MNSAIVAACTLAGPQGPLLRFAARSGTQLFACPCDRSVPRSAECFSYGWSRMQLQVHQRGSWAPGKASRALENRLNSYWPPVVSSFADLQGSRVGQATLHVMWWT